MKSTSLHTRVRRVRLVIFDVDGVLTDGTVFLDDDGREIKAFNVLDGAGIKYLGRAGIECAILSGRGARAVLHRARELGIRHVVQNSKRKLDGLAAILRATGLRAEDACFVGDDLTDIPVMREVGLAVAVPNARPEVRRLAHWVTRTPGGHGAARELAEKILKAQGKWAAIVARYGIGSTAAGEESC